MSIPKLDGTALYGLVGAVVETIEPHTEADPVALAADFLVSYERGRPRATHVRRRREAYQLAKTSASPD